MRLTRRQAQMLKEIRAGDVHLHNGTLCFGEKEIGLLLCLMAGMHTHSIL
jgi:hypothetical protein